MDGNSSGLSNSTIEIIIDAFTISLASLSTVGCIIALVVLIYFKLYRSFIYRLVLYSFLSLIILSSSTTAFTISYMQTEQVNASLIVTTTIFFYVSLAIPSLLATIINLCICVLALCNHQFTYRADIVLLIFSFALVAVMIISYIAFIPPLLNVFLTVLTLVPLCSRACGYNMCVKTVRTRESHRKALKEILPLLILPLPAYFPFRLTLSSLLFFFQGVHVALLFSGTLGLITTLSFALHLCFIGKANLNKQRGINKTPQVDYESANQHHTRHTTMYTMGEGISESCNTEYPYVSEGEEDTQYLQQRSNQQ